MVTSVPALTHVAMVVADLLQLAPSALTATVSSSGDSCSAPLISTITQVTVSTVFLIYWSLLVHKLAGTILNVRLKRRLRRLQLAFFLYLVIDALVRLSPLVTSAFSGSTMIVDFIHVIVVSISCTVLVTSLILLPAYEAVKAPPDVPDDPESESIPESLPTTAKPPSSSGPSPGSSSPGFKAPPPPKPKGIPESVSRSPSIMFAVPPGANLSPFAAHLSAILTRLASSETFKVFRMPYDSSVYPNWSSILPNHVDFSIIHTKIMDDAYGTLDDFKTDIGIIVTNGENLSESVNKPALGALARELEDKASKLIVPLPKERKHTLDTTTSGTVTSISSIATLPGDGPSPVQPKAVLVPPGTPELPKIRPLSSGSMMVLKGNPDEVNSDESDDDALTENAMTDRAMTLGGNDDTIQISGAALLPQG